MKIIMKDKNLIGAIFLILLAAILLISMSFANRHDLTSATVIISAVILFLTGTLLFSFSKNELIDGKIASLLHVQGTLNISSIASDMGIMGHAVFIPVKKDDSIIIKQFIPVSQYKKGDLSGDSFVSGSGGTGLYISPNGEPLLQELKQNNHLQIPSEENEILSLIQEIGVETLELSGKVETIKTGDGYVITLSHYSLLPGCKTLFKESPACCLMNPCPICSLFGMIIAEGLNTTMSLERCEPDLKKNSVNIFFKIIHP